jgi:dipeptidyl aminopeptidase/acylaminoacyl peptidase
MRSFAVYDPFAVTRDGRMLAYVVESKSPSMASNSEEQNNSVLHILDLETKREELPKMSAIHPAFPSWSPDGRYLAFCSQMANGRPESGGPSIWEWDRVSKRAVELLTVDQCLVNTFRWLNDSRRLIIASRIRRDPAKVEDEDKALSADVTRGAKAQEGAPRWYVSLGGEPNRGELGDAWDISESYDMIFVNAEKGNAHPVVTNVRVAGMWVSPVGDHVAVAVRKRFAHAGSQQLLYDLADLDSASGQLTVLAADLMLGPTPFTVSWSPDGTMLAARAAGRETRGELTILNLNKHTSQTFRVPGEHSGEVRFAGSVVQLPLWDRQSQSVLLAAQGKIWRASLGDGQVHLLANFPGNQVETIQKGEGAVWTVGQANAMVVIARDEGDEARSFWRINLATGERVKLFSGQFDVDSPLQMVVPQDSDALFFLRQSAAHPYDVWQFSTLEAEPRRLTNLNPELDRYPMSSSKIIEWRSLDGQVVRGSVLLPSAFDPGKRYPLVVGVYGGQLLSAAAQSWGLAGCETPINAQLLATRGYVVLCPDAPQSLGSPMYDLAKTVLPGINKLIDIGIADPDRVGLIGHSYGGYSVLSLLVQTNRFKAAVMSDGYGDLFSSYGVMDSAGASFGIAIDEKGQGLMGDTPWNVRDRYTENSPVFYLDRVQTPLLILHGGGDPTVPSFLADEVFVGLRRLGKTASYGIYPGEGHSAVAWSYDHYRDYLTRALDWLDKYVPTGADHKK